MNVANLQRTGARKTKATPVERRLSGPQKAAILFLCLGESRGSRLMQQLDTEEIQKITRAMSSLGVISAEIVEKVMSDFTEEVANGSGVVGSFTVAENLLRSLLPEDQVETILKDIRGPLKERDLWARFSALNENVIANYLKKEHPQTIAAILSNVKTDVAAKVLPLLGAEKMQDVIERMVRMESVPHHMMKQIEETIQSDIINSSDQPTTAELYQRMADLFNKLDRPALDAVSAGLEENIPDAFASIKQKMFTFEDLAKMDPLDLAKVMRGVAGNTLPTALRGANKETRELFFRALPGRSRDMLMEEINAMAPVRRREVREAQSAMLDLAKTLAEDEVVRLPVNDEDQDELF
ncbi:flagellar motor switch protein FliG [Pseudooceanicola aestuarii]|uniref:flagellar motor switch protein FliG n=1 Tax=Pseudooceanicola aestuarii TaxID=2697319 RepID=UPI0013D239F1|nr:flagellar motor switch protein FliG [Pseudooceanicola aestuarii]